LLVSDDGDVHPYIPSLEVFLMDMVFYDEVGSWNVNQSVGTTTTDKSAAGQLELIRLEKIINVGNALKGRIARIGRK
jgi:hypothetical protein